MSRYKDWTRGLEGIWNYIKESGLPVNPHNSKKESEIINEYSKEKKLKGSFTDRVLTISNNFEDFKKFIKEKTKNIKKD